MANVLDIAEAPLPAVDEGESLAPRMPLIDAQQQLAGLLDGEFDLIANTANFSAFLNALLPSINWLGFYFLQGDELVLGPFQGQVACVRIPVGKGVCGRCVATGATQRIDDVLAFPGHIACDVRSRSELVVPMRRRGEIFGVLDIDSPRLARFGASDQDYAESLLDVFATHQFSSDSRGEARA